MNTHHSADQAINGRDSRLYDLASRWLLRGVYQRFAEDITDAAPEDAAVLDVGTGPGVLLCEIARRRHDLRLTGVDVAPDMAAAARRNARPYGARVTVRTGSATDLPFPDDSFDLLVSSFSLHHWGEPERAAPELARVLRPGGRLYIYDFRSAPFSVLENAAREHGVLAGRPHRRTPIRLSGAAGLVIPRCSRQVLTNEPTEAQTR